jgi:hypothetical protein
MALSSQSAIEARRNCYATGTIDLQMNHLRLLATGMKRSPVKVADAFIASGGRQTASRPGHAHRLARFLEDFGRGYVGTQTLAQDEGTSQPPPSARTSPTVA